MIATSKTFGFFFLKYTELRLTYFDQFLASSLVGLFYEIFTVERGVRDSSSMKEESVRSKCETRVKYKICARSEKC